jgi:hypothetical protein
MLAGAMEGNGQKLHVKGTRTFLLTFDVDL